MKIRSLYLGLFALAALLAAPQLAARLTLRSANGSHAANTFVAAAQDKEKKRWSDDDDDFTERDNFDQNYQLAPGAQVRVSGINGSVTGETSNTTTAEVHI